MPEAGKKPRGSIRDHGTLDAIVKLTGGAGIVALIPLLLSISGKLDRNCDTIADGARITAAIVRVDDELSRPANQQLRELLLSEAKKLGGECGG